MRAGIGGRLERWLVVGLTVLAVRGPALAAPVHARLSYERGVGAEHCPDEIAVRRAVEARLGTDPFVEPAQVSIQATLVREDGILRGHLRVQSVDGKAQGARDFSSRGNDCAELAATLQLAIVIAIDPLVVSRPVAAPTPAAPTVVPPAAPPPVPAAIPAAAPPPASTESAWKHPTLHASVGAVANLFAAPSTSFGLTLGIGARWTRFSLSLEGRADLPASEAVGGGRAATSLLLASLAPCVRAAGLGGCLMVSGGALRASGEGLDVSRQATTPYLAAGGRLFWEFGIASVFSARLHGDLLTPILRTTLLSNDQPIWRTPAVFLTLGASAVASLP